MTEPTNQPPLEDLLKQMANLGHEHGLALYEILFRNAGVAVVWIHPVALPDHFDPNDVFQAAEQIKASREINAYHPTLRQAILAEIARFQEVKA